MQRDKAARFQQTLTRFKQERFAACKHEAPTQLRVNTEQISTWPSHNLTGQHDDMLECACSHEWCIYLHTNTFLLMIRRVVVWFPSTWWPPCGNSGCTHGLGDSKESRHRHLLFYCWIADDWYILSSASAHFYSVSFLFQSFSYTFSFFIWLRSRLVARVKL